MMKKETMSGSELCRYLHISTRKMKYLMDHDYIKHENTGQATHKYRVYVKDARSFKRRMETEPDFLSELTGLFNSGCSSGKHSPKERVVIDSEGFQNYLLLLWEALPDALPTQQAARLISVNPQRIHEQIRAGTLHGAKIGGRQYCVPTSRGSVQSSDRRIYPAENDSAIPLTDVIIYDNIKLRR